MKYFKATPHPCLLQSILISLHDCCSQKLPTINKIKRRLSQLFPSNSFQRLVRKDSIFSFCSRKPVIPLVIQKQEVA